MSDGNEGSGFVLAPPSPNGSMTLFMKLGGEGTFPVFCENLYTSVLGPIDPQGQTQPSLADPILWPYFAPFLSRRGDARAHLERKLTQVLVLATKGEIGKPEMTRLRDAHRGLNIPDEVFDRLLHHVRVVLAQMGVRQEVQQEVLDLLNSIRGLFVVRA